MESTTAIALRAGLTALSHVRILEMLAEQDGRPTSSFTEGAKLRSGGLTLAIDSLIKRGLVVRRTNPDDRRQILVFLSPKGRRLVAKFPKPTAAGGDGRSKMADGR